MPETREAGVECRDWLFPLDEFYRREGRALPRVERVRPEAIPEPERSLLVHDNDMTPTLEAFHGGDIHIEVWGREVQGSDYFREVVLRLDRDQRPVEFGVNRIHLDRFGSRERRLILDEYVPLGRILHLGRVPHRGGPRAFLKVWPDDLMRRALGLAGPVALYGRRNTIVNAAGEPLSEIVEILPPGAGRAAGG
ncbi:MAG: hypothetical protein D6766_12040 [Verrucomicrobia bacterium]|nr:MAG: hypothetical protein D6766_12040 [Verrucomicrobiota bacterium]